MQDIIYAKYIYIKYIYTDYRTLAFCAIPLGRVIVPQISTATVKKSASLTIMMNNFYCYFDCFMCIYSICSL